MTTKYLSMERQDLLFHNRSPTPIATHSVDRFLKIIRTKKNELIFVLFLLLVMRKEKPIWMLGYIKGGIYYKTGVFIPRTEVEEHF